MGVSEKVRWRKYVYCTLLMIFFSPKNQEKVGTSLSLLLVVKLMKIMNKTAIFLAFYVNLVGVGSFFTNHSLLSPAPFNFYFSPLYLAPSPPLAQLPPCPDLAIHIGTFYFI